MSVEGISIFPTESEDAAPENGGVMIDDSLSFKKTRLDLNLPLKDFAGCRTSK